MRIEGMQSTTSKKQLACHTRIKGHSLDEQVNATAQGSTGRDAAARVFDLIRRRRLKEMAGRPLLVAGSSASEKTAALALGMKVPFCPLAVSEVYSSEAEKTEALMEKFCRDLGLRRKENKEVHEGAVTELSPEEAESTTG